MAANSQYRFPPGPEANLLWSALRKLRPANPLNHYTEMVFSESMRLFPPTWTMGRKALDDFHLGPCIATLGTFPIRCASNPKGLRRRAKGNICDSAISRLEQGRASASASRLRAWKACYCWPCSRKTGSCDLFPATRLSPHRSLPCGQSTVCVCASNAGTCDCCEPISLNRFSKCSSPTPSWHAVIVLEILPQFGCRTRKTRRYGPLRTTVKTGIDELLQRESCMGFGPKVCAAAPGSSACAQVDANCDCDGHYRLETRLEYPRRIRHDDNALQ